MKTNNTAYLALATTSLIWGSTWVVMKWGIQGMPPLQLAAIRQLLGGLILVGFFLYKGEAFPSQKQLFQIFILSIFTFVLANGLSTWSLQYLPSGLAALIGALYPLSVVVMEYFIFKNKQINTATVVGVLLGIAGIATVLSEHVFISHTPGFAWGILLASIAMLSWSYSTIMIGRSKVNINPYFGMGWQMLFSSGMIAILALIKGNNLAFSEIPTNSWIAIAYLIVMGSLLAMMAFIYTMKHLPAPIASLYAYINPIVAIMIGTVVLDEHITWQLIVGTVITLLGVYLVNKSFKKNSI